MEGSDVETIAGTLPLQYRVLGFSPDPQPPPPCVGDCSGTSAVAISDLITLVRIALGEAPPSDCLNGVPSTGGVDVAAIVVAVGNALNGCEAG